MNANQPREMPMLVTFQWYDLTPVNACDLNVPCRLDSSKGQTDVYRADALISHEGDKVTCRKCIILMEHARMHADPQVYRPSLDTSP